MYLKYRGIYYQSKSFSLSNNQAKIQSKLITPQLEYFYFSMIYRGVQYTCLQCLNISKNRLIMNLL